MPGKIVSPRNKWKDPEGGYKEFIIGDLFKIVKGKRLTKAHMLPGDIKFIGATSTNNGLTAKIGNTGHLHPAGTITVTYNGSVGEAFYQTEQFWASDDVNVLYPKFPMNDNVALYFLAPLIKKGKSYGYSYKWTKEKMKKDSIFLPVNLRGEVDCGFIEERVRELKEERVRELEAYLSEAGLEDCTLTDNEKEAVNRVNKCEVSYIPVKIGDKLIGEKGDVDIQNKDINGRGLYFVNSGVQNFGIKGLTDRKAKIFPRNTITIDFLGNVYYRPFNYVMATHNHVFSLSGEIIRNENIGLYLCSSMSYLNKIYSFSNMGTWPVYKESHIFLPTTLNCDEIDYAFMDTYINAIKKQCIANLKSEIERERKANGQVLREQIADVNFTKQDKPKSHYSEEYFEPLMAAEPFEYYNWNQFDHNICDFFGGDKTILVGCYKGKKYFDWILSHQIYNIRLGNAKGSMEANRELFDRTSLLVLYELGKPSKLSAYKIVGNKEMDKEELLAMDYPNKKPRKCYMTFSITPLEMDLTFLADHHLVERLIELNLENAKGTPVFIQP